MRIEQLEYVAAIAQLGSFRRAAEELHISQPALSESVRKLERELGVEILDRTRTGARVSERGAELLPHIVGTLEAVDRLRRAADEHHRTSRTVRLGTVTAATVPLLTPTIKAFRGMYPSTQVEVLMAQQLDIHRGIREGSLDLGLVNYLDGDDLPPDLDSAELLRGRAVVCMRPDSPLARRASVPVAELLRQPLGVMRPGYVMHRFVHRLLEGCDASFSYAADGAEMGKLMVAEGLGATILPEFSVAGDPLEQRGAIVYRPIENDDTTVRLVIQRRRSGSAAVPRAARDLHGIFVERARTYSEAPAQLPAAAARDSSQLPAPAARDSSQLPAPAARDSSARRQ